MVTLYFFRLVQSNNCNLGVVIKMIQSQTQLVEKNLTIFCFLRLNKRRKLVKFSLSFLEHNLVGLFENYKK